MDLLILAARRGTSQLDNAQSNEKRLISILKALKKQAEKRQKVENKKDLSKSWLCLAPALLIISTSLILYQTLRWMCGEIGNIISPMPIPVTNWVSFLI